RSGSPSLVVGIQTCGARIIHRHGSRRFSYLVGVLSGGAARTGRGSAGGMPLAARSSAEAQTEFTTLGAPAMLTIRAMSDGKGYSTRHLEHRDYYAEGERVVGQWQGHGAQLLALSGEVRLEDFEALREGRDPKTGEFLRQRQGADRIG